MKNRKIYMLLGIFLSTSVWFHLMAPGSLRAEGITKEQGEEILSELKKIRNFLEIQPGRTLRGPSPSGKERVKIKIDDRFFLGSQDASLTLLEFTDYQCPYCKRFQTNIFPELKKTYIDTGKIRFIKRDLPLPFHQQAMKSAQVGRCAGDQGKYWEMHNLLSSSSAVLEEKEYIKFAQDLILDIDKFKECIGSEKHLSEIKNSIEGARSVGITGTPAFILGTIKGDTLEGVKIVGAQPIAVFDKAIRELLPQQEKTNTTSSTEKK